MTPSLFFAGSTGASAVAITPTMPTTPIPGGAPSPPAASPPPALPPELLESLRDVVSPTTPSWWPPAPGWWLLGLAVLGLAVAVLRWRRRIVLRRAAKKEAVADLDALLGDWRQNRNNVDADRVYADGAMALMRRVGIRWLGRDAIARRTGTDFIDALNGLSSAPMSRAVGEALARAQYERPTEDGKGAERASLVERLHPEIRHWLDAVREPNDA